LFTGLEETSGFRDGQTNTFRAIKDQRQVFPRSHVHAPQFEHVIRKHCLLFPYSQMEQENSCGETNCFEPYPIDEVKECNAFGELEPTRQRLKARSERG
jgi:hypothetical protein